MKFIVKKSNRLNVQKNLFCFLCIREKVEKSSSENFKLIRNALANKKGNPESLQKKS